MKSAIAAVLLLISCAGLRADTFAERRSFVVNQQAHPPSLVQAGYTTIAAKLYLKEDAAWCSRSLLEILKAPIAGDMFWMFPVTAIAHLDQGQLTPEARKALRDAWRTYAPYRGDTENHWLLYYTCLYLMSQLYPDQPGDQWYTGKSSAENLKESKDWIESWVKLTTTRGQGEYDCMHYLGVYLLPMSYLSQWSTDPAMKQRATMMIEYLMGDSGAENLNGLYAGSHARTDDKMVLEKQAAVSSDFFWLWFGTGHPQQPYTGPYVLYYSIARGYEPPEILRQIGTDRSQPYTHLEKKRTRNRWRFQDERHGPVYKTTYMRREYAVSSDQGGVLQPIQQHSWDVTWSVPDARGKYPTLFSVNPHSSLRELQTYFVFGPDFGNEAVVRSKKMYDSPDKLLGGSPYEKIFQNQDTVIVLYDVPREQRFPHVNAFFSKDLTELTEDASGWIFARGGDALIAYKPLQPYVWKPVDIGGMRLFSQYSKNGAVVQVAAASEYANFDAFRKAILALSLQVSTDPTPSVRFRSLRGKTMQFTYGQTPTVDGRPVDYDAWPLFGGPFLQAGVDSEQLTLKHGNRTRTLDFRKLTIEESEAR